MKNLFYQIKKIVMRFYYLVFYIDNQILTENKTIYDEITEYPTFEKYL